LRKYQVSPRTISGRASFAPAGGIVVVLVEVDVVGGRVEGVVEDVVAVSETARIGCHAGALSDASEVTWVTPVPSGLKT
jgi:hypothetical protein